MRNRNEVMVTVHPFFRVDGEDRTKHTTTLAKAIAEIVDDGDSRDIQAAPTRHMALRRHATPL